MTRTALARTPSLPPCMLAPELWDSSDNTAAIAACRRQCPRRFACAQEALSGPKHLVSSLNGVIAGIAIPEQNEYGTSKAHKAALKRLETIAEIGRAAGVTTVNRNPGARSRPAADPVHHDAALRAPAARHTESPAEGPELRPVPEQPAWDQPEVTRVLRVPPGDWRTETEGCCRKPPPNGQVDVHGASRITGLTVSTLRHYRQLGCGPRSWLTVGGPRGVIRYWVADIEAWMAQRRDRPTAAPTARAS